MKGFLLRFLLFLGGAIVLLNIIAWLLLLAPNPVAHHMSWFKIYERILRSQQKISSDTLYIGDSVGNQYFPFDKTSNSLTANGAILVAGHYILASMAIERNPQIKTVLLVSVPTELCRNFERKGTYNNFVKPFFSFDSRKYFSSLIYQKMKKKPFSFLSIFKAWKILPFSDINFDDNSPEPVELSDVSLDYLVKLREMCDSKNINLKLVSMPVPSYLFEDTHNFEKLRSQIRDKQLEFIFGSYLDSIVPLDRKYFKDRIHLKSNYVDTFRHFVKK